MAHDVIAIGDLDYDVAALIGDLEDDGTDPGFSASGSGEEDSGGGSVLEQGGQLVSPGYGGGGGSPSNVTGGASSGDDSPSYQPVKYTDPGGPAQFDPSPVVPPDPGPPPTPHGLGGDVSGEELPTWAKIALGVGAVATVTTIGVVAYKHAKKKRR